MKENDIETWGMMNMLMAHAGDINEQHHDDDSMDGVFDFILNTCRMTQFSEAEVKHIIGVVNINSFILGLNKTRDVQLHGVFPLSSLLNHSCIANTMSFPPDDQNFTCKAVTLIKKG